MTSPAFTRTVIDTLARRARFQCSNPDCGVQTVAPNSDPEKATVIGEAAHIQGALPGAKRYDPEMSDVTRSAITNGIWLCRNCHGKIDRDALEYSTDLLFAWRKAHENRVLVELGTRGDVIRDEVTKARLEFLHGYPQIVLRIVLDKPKGWEWRFVAELTRHLNKNQFKRLRNMRIGHYFRAYPRVRDAEFLSWIVDRAHVMRNLVRPYVPLLDRLTASFGLPGKPADLEEMYDVCTLLHEMLVEIVRHEEVLRFTSIPDDGEALRSLLMDAVGKNAEGLQELPKVLDDAVAMIDTDHGGTNENPRIITWKVPFTLPDDFVHSFETALSEYTEKVELS